MLSILPLSSTFCLLLSLFSKHKKLNCFGNKSIHRIPTKITMSSEQTNEPIGGEVQSSNSNSANDGGAVDVEFNPLMDAQTALERMQLSSKQDDASNSNSNVNVSSPDSSDEWQAAPTKNSKRRGRNKGQSNPAHWNSPPIMVESIPPSPFTENFSPFLILLIGLPGSGKSTFSTLLETAMPYKFARVSQDQLGSRKKCVKSANRVLDEKKCVILDRCNYDPAQRATWFDLAKKRKIPVHGIALQVPKQLCIQRCQGREAHETIAPKDAAKVVNIVSRCYRLPSKEEQGQFRSYRTIQNSSMLDDAVLQFLNQNE